MPLVRLVALVGTGTSAGWKGSFQVISGDENHLEVMVHLILGQVAFFISNGSSTSLELLLLP